VWEITVAALLFSFSAIHWSASLFYGVCLNHVALTYSMTVTVSCPWWANLFAVFPLFCVSYTATRMTGGPRPHTASLQLWDLCGDREMAARASTLRENVCFLFLAFPFVPPQLQLLSCPLTTRTRPPKCSYRVLGNFHSRSGQLRWGQCGRTQWRRQDLWHAIEQVKPVGYKSFGIYFLQANIGEWGNGQLVTAAKTLVWGHVPCRIGIDAHK